jgi:endonuclease YncB( thermonuclease family)
VRGADREDDDRPRKTVSASRTQRFTQHPAGGPVRRPIALEHRRPLSRPRPAPPAAWRAAGVRDGDTLPAADADNVEHKPRLSGIDAPEIGQPFGSEARDGLAAMGTGKPVAIHGDGRARNAAKRELAGR